MALPTTTEFEPHAAALQDCILHDVDAYYEMLCDDGAISRYSARNYLSFDAYECPLHGLAMASASGWIWDLGAGAGRHALVLQALGDNVLAIDQSQLCVDLMRRRGVQHAVCRDVFDLHQGHADHMLLLDHNIGMAGTVERLPALLAHLRTRLSVGGSLWVDGSDGRGPAFLRRGYTELRGRLRYKALTGAEFPWLYVSKRTLTRMAEEVGLHCVYVVGISRGPYLARLQRRN